MEFHFRIYLKSKHPALIVGETETEYLFRKVTSSERDGRHLNDKIEPNPDKTRNTPMYIARRIRRDKKKYFSTLKLPWKL